VLTHRWQSASRASVGNTTTHPHDDASSLRKRCACDCQHHKKPLCRSRFCNSRAHRTTRIRRHRDSSTSQKARRTDSESRFLAMKKFSRLPASRLIVARQNRIFARIAVADSLAGISRLARCIARYGERLMHASVLINGATAATKASHRDDDGVTSRAVQMPSLALSRSLTACGLALPPDDFIT
jgi:hypothetical protein